MWNDRSVADNTDPGGIDPSTPIAAGATVEHFWRWAFSSLAENATRGVFAEYLVGLALDVTDQPRVEWDAADLRYRGALIEVKSSADHQVWKQTKPSTIRFDIGRKNWWNAETNEMSPVKERPAAIYIFCHYTGPAEPVHVVNADHWTFYVCPTSTLDEHLDDQQSAGLTTIRRFAEPVHYGDLQLRVDATLAAGAQR